MLTQLSSRRKSDPIQEHETTLLDQILEVLEVGDPPEDVESHTSSAAGQKQIRRARFRASNRPAKLTRIGAVFAGKRS